MSPKRMLPTVYRMVKPSPLSSSQRYIQRNEKSQL